MKRRFFNKVLSGGLFAASLPFVSFKTFQSKESETTPHPYPKPNSVVIRLTDDEASFLENELLEKTSSFYQSLRHHLSNKRIELTSATQMQPEFYLFEFSSALDRKGFQSFMHNFHETAGFPEA